MSLISDINSIKSLQQGLVNNKVTRFAYTQQAYDNNDVNGHDDYVASRANNIPTSDIAVMKVNQTVVDKGFRARASSITRMLMNHFFGRTSYNLNKAVDLFYSVLTSFATYLGQPNGLATLDATGRIPHSQLPEDAIEYLGAWNATTNTPHLADGTGTTGDTYVVEVAGTQNLGSGDITFFVNDRVIYNGSVWQRFGSGDVKTVAEIAPDTTGNVDLTQQTNLNKIFNNSFLSVLLSPFTGIYWKQSSLQYLRFYKANNLLIAEALNSQDLMRMFWSEDGKNFTEIASLVHAYQAIYYDEDTGIWSAVTSGYSAWSMDGKTWTETANSILNNTSYATIVKANGIWVASAYNSLSSSAQLLWSEDGKSWNTGTYPTGHQLSGALLFSVVLGYWIALTESYDFISSDGKTWSRGTISNSGRGICEANNIIIENKKYNEGNGWLDCTSNDSKFTSYDLYDIKCANGLWVASGVRLVSGYTTTAYEGIWYSHNGVNWILAYEIQVPYQGGLATSGIAYDSIWLVSIGGSLLYSYDGENWNTCSTEGSSQLIKYKDVWLLGYGAGFHGYYSDWSTVQEWLSNS